MASYLILPRDYRPIARSSCSCIFLYNVTIIILNFCFAPVNLFSLFLLHAAAFNAVRLRDIST